MGDAAVKCNLSQGPNEFVTRVYGSFPGSQRIWKALPSIATAYIFKFKISEAGLCPRALKSSHLVGLDFCQEQMEG